MTKLNITGIVFLSIFFTGCGAAIKARQTKDLTSQNAPKYDGEVKIYGMDEKIGRDFQETGEVYIDDSGLSISCDYENAVQVISEKTIAAKADAAYIYDHRTPDIESSCHRVKAKLIVYRAPKSNRLTNPIPTVVTNGTAFLLSDDGYLATAYTVTAKAKQLSVYSPATNMTYSAEVVMEDSEKKITILKIRDKAWKSPGHPPYQIQSPEDLEIGKPVYTAQSVYAQNRIKLVKYDVTSLDGAKNTSNVFTMKGNLASPQVGGPLFDATGSIVGVAFASIGDHESLGVKPKHFVHQMRVTRNIEIPRPYDHNRAWSIEAFSQRLNDYVFAVVAQ